MKKFLFKGILLIVIIMAVILAASTIMPFNPNHYMSAQRAKIARLDTLTSPRIIIVGGSNAAFGFNSQRLEDSLGINVVNTALHASVGLKFSMQTAIDYAHLGDIVVIIPEYSQFKSVQNYRGTADVLASAVIYSGADAWKRLDPMQLALVTGGLPKHYLGVIKARQKSVWDYNGRNFNRWGDEAAHWTVKTPGNKELMLPQSAAISSKVVGDFAAKVQTLQQRRIKVIILWPTTIQTNYENFKPFICALEEEFHKHGLKFSNSPATFVHADSLAFDTPYHMSYPAVETNTDSLIQIISIVLGKN